MARTPFRPGPDTPYADALALLGQNFDVIDDQDDTKIIRNGSVPTLLLGRQVGGFGGQDYGLKIAKPGYDVTVATADQLIFNSSQNVFKVVRTGTATADLGVGAPDFLGYFADTITIPHSLGYSPVPFVFMDDALGSGTRVPLPYFFLNPNTVADTFDIVGRFFVEVDDTNLYIKSYFSVSGAGGFAGSFSFSYYLLQETAN